MLKAGVMERRERKKMRAKQAALKKTRKGGRRGRGLISKNSSLPFVYLLAVLPRSLSLSLCSLIRQPDARRERDSDTQKQNRQAGMVWHGMSYHT